MKATARSFLLDLLSTVRRGSLPVSALVAAGALFGIGENSLRVALARMRAAGLVESDERGRYRLGAAAGPVARHTRAWHDLEDRLRPWRGGWVAVHDLPDGPRPPRSEQRRAERARRLLGLARLAPGLDLRPDNLRGGIPTLRLELAALGLPPSSRVFEMRQLDDETEARARALWDGRALRDGYRAMLAELARSERRLPGLSDAQAMRESFLLGGRVIRRLVVDPLLPEPLAPAAERAALVRAMRRYDRAGRARWADFMRQSGVKHYVDHPADTRMTTGPGAPGL